MIQDREMQALWDAVEEIRKRVEALESNGHSEEVAVDEAVTVEVEAEAEYDYVASATSNRKTFHRRGCKFTLGFIQVADGFHQFSTHEEALAAGRVPCKSCDA